MPLRVDGDGKQTRDFVHVDDIVSVNLFCGDHAGKFAGECFDVGSGKTISLNEIKAFVDATCTAKWHRGPERIGDIKYISADVEPLRNLGWQAKVDIAEGLKKCFIGETK